MKRFLAFFIMVFVQILTIQVIANELTTNNTNRLINKNNKKLNVFANTYTKNNYIANQTHKIAQKPSCQF